MTGHYTEPRPTALSAHQPLPPRRPRSFTGHAGDLIIATGSVDNTGTYVFEVEPEGVSPTDSKQVAYWTTANGFDTMYSLWNPTAQAEDLTVTFYYGDGSGSYVLPVHLAANGSTMIDVMMLIESGQPDANGHMFPMTETAGSAIIRNTVAGNVKTVSGTSLPAPMTLVAAGGTFNVETATCGVTCITCSGYSNPAVTPNPVLCPVGDSMQLTFEATDSNGDVVYPSATWSSTDTSVMTVNSNGLATAIMPGACSIIATFSTTVEISTGQYCSGTDPVCPTGQPSAGSNATVGNVVITSVDLPSDQVSVTLSTGSATASGTLTVTWNGPSGNADIADQTEGPGGYTFNPSLGGLVTGQYSGVSATWRVDDVNDSTSYSDSFNVLGTYLNTQYNTPAESQCTGSSATAYLTTGPTACPWSTVSLISAFIGQAWENGSGATNNYGLIQEYLAGCSAPPGGNMNYFREVSLIQPACAGGSLSNTTVAINASNASLQCGDQVLIVGLGSGLGTVKEVTDHGGGLSLTQLDNYNTSGACSTTALPSFGNLQTIRINR